MIALINLLVNFSIFIFLLFYDVYRPVALSALCALAMYVLLRWYVSKRQNPRTFFDEFVFFIPAMCWFGLHSYLLMVALVLMGFLYRFSLQPIRLVFGSGGVVKTNFPKKEYSWDLIANVILRDHILTIDFKNNRLIQAEIEQQPVINEKVFNEFVQSKISTVENSLS